MINVFLSIFFWVACVTLLAALYLTMLLLLVLTFPFDPQRKILHRQCFWWSSSVIGLNPFWKLKVEGLENIDHKKTYVIVANHQSLADIVVLYQIRAQFKWVAKESLFRIPFLGWCLGLCRHIALKRNDMASIREVYAEARKYIQSKMSVLFFPEGTRSETDEMNPFQNGAFKLAISEKVPILPIVLHNTRDAIPKGDWVMKSEMRCRLTVLKPIETETFSVGDFALVRDKVRARINDKLVLYRDE